MSTLEEKLQTKADERALGEALERFECDEVRCFKKGNFNLLCRSFGHKRGVYHQQISEIVEDRKKFYEAWICTRCSDTELRLVMVVDYGQKDKE